MLAHTAIVSASASKVKQLLAGGIPPADYYVSTLGDDTTGDGSIGNPFRTSDHATAQALPGDFVYMRDGTYAPFEVMSSGTPGKMITVTAYPGDTNPVIIQGDLQQHSTQGGPGVTLPLDNAVRDGVRIDSKDYIRISNLTIQWVWRHGIFIVGTEGEQHGHHIITGNTVQHVGRGGIFAGGNNSDTVIPAGETTNLRTIDITISANDVTQTNLEIEGQGFGNVEAIAVASSVDGFLIDGNHIFDTLQYGVDAKAGVMNGVISNNLIETCARHGIYLDAGHRFVKNVAIFGNTVKGCKNGLVLSRENGDAGNTNLVLEDIDAHSNTIIDCAEIGIYLQKHPGDIDAGVLRRMRFLFNTVVDSNRTGTTFRDFRNDFDNQAGNYPSVTMTGNEFVGNLFMSDQDINMLFDPAAPGWTYAHNFNVANGINTPTDPLFFDAANDDYTLTTPSTARGLVSAPYVVSPFDVDINGNTRAIPANAGAISGSVDGFAFVLSGGEIQIENNDGRNFTIDDALDRYDGTYSIDQGSLANGPALMKAPVLAGDADPVAGENLTIIPALFAYEGDLGAISINYTTNGTNAVDATDPHNPILLIDAADAGQTITVTATATQGLNTRDGVSNGVAIGAAASGLQVDVIAIRANTTAAGTITETIDLSAYGADDKLYVAYGITRNPNGAVTVDGNAASSIHFNLTGGGGARLRVFEYVLPGPGDANTVISLGLNGSSSTDHIIPIWVVKNGVLGTPSADGDAGAQTNSGGSVAATATPASTNNLLVAVTTGRPGMFGTGGDAHAFTNATEVDDLIAANAGAAIATVATGATTAHTVTFTPNPTAAASDDAAIALIPFTEAA